MVSVAMPLSQQAGYYCNVCDCVLRDSQSYLDHINGGWLAGSAGGSTGGGWARCARGSGSCCACGSRCLLAACFQSLCRSGCCTSGMPCAAPLTLNWGVSLSVAAKPSGKWHNRALGMSMRVEKSTAEQVCLASKPPQQACSINLCVASCKPTLPTHVHVLLPQVRQRLEAAKKRKDGGGSSAADFAPDGGDACQHFRCNILTGVA